MASQSQRRAEHPANAIKAAVQQLWEQARWQDLTIVCVNGVVACNRAYLAARSPYFESLLYGSYKEASADEVELPCEKAALSALLHFLHMGELPKGDDLGIGTLLETCQLAQQYALPDLQAMAVERIASSLRDETLGTVLDRAASLGLHELELLALQRCSHMHVRPNCFASFSPAALKLCLSAAHLRASEASVLEAVLWWGRAQLAEQSQHGGCRMKGSPKRRVELLQCRQHKQQRLQQGKGSRVGDGRSEADVAPAEAAPAKAAHAAEGLHAEALRLVLKDMLPHVHLECITSDVLASLTAGTGLLDDGALAALRVAQADADMPGLSAQYARRPWDVLQLVAGVTCNDVDVVQFSNTMHKGARSRHRLSAGRYVCHLVIERYSTCTWVGVVDDSADMSHWLGFQEGAWMMGSNGSVSHAAVPCTCSAAVDGHSCPLSARERVFYGDTGYHVQPYGTRWDSNDTRIAMHVDMDLRQLAFEVNGEHCGIAFHSLPDAVYPAVSMRDGGRCRYAACMQL